MRAAALAHNSLLTLPDLPSLLSSIASSAGYPLSLAASLTASLTPCVCASTPASPGVFAVELNHTWSTDIWVLAQAIGFPILLLALGASCFVLCKARRQEKDIKAETSGFIAEAPGAQA